MNWDDDRLIELVGRFSTLLSRGVCALETIASAQTAMAEIEIERYNEYRFSRNIPKVALRPAQCPEPCCQREAR